MSIKVDVSVGEFIDKLTILQIKSERISDNDKLVNINKEKSVLEAEWKNSEYSKVDISKLKDELFRINESLWEIEDDIRDKEFAKEFDEKFIELARAVYVTNDERARVKKEINALVGSELTEEKSYKDYK